MTYDDDDEPTSPGIGGPIVVLRPLDPTAGNAALAARTSAGDQDARPTVPAPVPDRLDPTPRAVPKPPPLPQIDRALEAFVAREESDAELEDRTTTPLHEHDIETWRPPPPAQKERAEAVAAVIATVTAKPKPSSIAPREVARKEPPARNSSAALIGLGMLALLGAGALYRSNASKSHATAASTAPQPAQESVAIARPDTHLVATEPPRVVEPLPPVEVKADSKASEAVPAVDQAAPAIAGRAREPRAPRKKAQAIAPGDLPEQPSRKMIGDALGALRADIATCAGGKPGVAELDLTLNGSGSVSQAIVGGDFAGSPQGSCIARTVRRAHVAPFQQPKFRVLYRLML